MVEQLALALPTSSQLSLLEVAPISRAAEVKRQGNAGRMARAVPQLSLLEVAPAYEIASNAHARNAYGAAAAEIVCAALGLAAIPIDGSCETCFDAEGGGFFYEIKSVKKRGKVVVYDWRISKESRAGVPLLYAVLCHGVKGERDGSRLFASMAASGLELVVVPADLVHVAALEEPLHTLSRSSTDPRNGYNRAGYREGYRNLPVQRLSACTTSRTPVAFELYGVAFSVDVLR